LAKFTASRRKNGSSSVRGLLGDTLMSSANTAALTELNAALGRQIANVLKQAGFYARLVRNIGAAKTEGVTRTGHIGARDGSAKGQAQH
jgi:hypothetical protein